MKILIDTNVVLDILLNRQPWYIDAALIFSMTKQNYFQSYVSATTITDIFYITKKVLGKSGAKEALKNLFKVFCPASVKDNDIYKALNLEWDDFEDSVQFIIGEGLSVDYIVTRNIRDYTTSHIKIIAPDKFLEIFTENDDEK